MARRLDRLGPTFQEGTLGTPSPKVAGDHAGYIYIYTECIMYMQTCIFPKVDVYILIYVFICVYMYLHGL